MRLIPIGVLATLMALMGVSAAPLAADHNELSLTPVSDLPLAAIGLRHPLPEHPGSGDQGQPASPPPSCDKDVDTTSTFAGVVPTAAQDNGICTSADIDVYDNGGNQYVVQAGGQEEAFTITRIAPNGAPTLVTQKAWLQSNTYTPDVKAFKQGTNRYIVLSLERLAIGNSACGVVIVDVTNVEDSGHPTPIVDQVFASGDWCDVHNTFVEKDTNSDGRYIYLTADFPNDMRVLDIGDLTNIIEIGRYTHPEASNDNYVHDVTVIDHGGSIGRRVYVSYWNAGLMILNAAHVTPGVIEAGSPNQPLNPDHSIDPAGFLTHHAYPSEDGTRLFIQDEFLSSAGQEPVQMWDIASPASPSYVDGISLGSALMPVVNPAHNLLVVGTRLYAGWYKAGLQAFDFDSTGFVGRPIYHQVQTEAGDDPYDGAWGLRLGTIGTDTYVFQSDRRYGLIVDRLDPCSAAVNPGQPDTDGDGLIDACDLDDDNDGWYDVAEASIGTQPLQACGGANAWPADTDGNGIILGSDVFFITSRFFLTSSSPSFTPRADIGNLTGPRDGIIIGSDVFAVTSRFFTSC
ncbi:MAG: hypothetical protein IH822_05470 [Chloroflexi bacterium]|nr:hypothetical protein [Chloroflexota bacterium]